MSKSCKMCKSTKTEVDFPKKENGRWHICKACFDENSVEYGDVDTLVEKLYEKRKEKEFVAVNMVGNIVEMEMTEIGQRAKYASVLLDELIDINKTCRTCNVTRHLSNFHKNYRYKDGHNTQCRYCVAKWRPKQ